MPFALVFPAGHFLLGRPLARSHTGTPQSLEQQMNDLIELHQNEIENLKQGKFRAGDGAGGSMEDCPCPRTSLRRRMKIPLCVVLGDHSHFLNDSPLALDCLTLISSLCFFFTLVFIRSFSELAACTQASPIWKKKCSTKAKSGYATCTKCSSPVRPGYVHNVCHG